jgi:hypothetical protein
VLLLVKKEDRQAVPMFDTLTLHGKAAAPCGLLRKLWKRKFSDSLRWLNRKAMLHHKCDKARNLCPI